MHPDGFDPRGAEGNKERKLAMIRADATHAALVFEGDECVGWAQFGPPSEVARIKNRPAAEKDRELPDWRIGCCYAGKGHRRQGVVGGGDRRGAGPDPGPGRRDGQGYPEDAADVSAGFLYHGALASYEKLGFERVVKVGKHRWVVTKRV